MEGSRLCISARSTSPTAECPTCHQISNRLHSYYLRSPADLPVSGQTVHLKLRVRRFRCQNPHCKQQTFAERFPQTLAVHAQRTQRLNTLLTLFALALSGRPGERLLVQVGMPTSADTLLRLVKCKLRDRKQQQTGVKNSMPVVSSTVSKTLWRSKGCCIIWNDQPSIT